MKNKEERALKLKMITEINLISHELTLRKLKFSYECGLFEIALRKTTLYIQIEDGVSISNCWINLSIDKCFDLCQFNLVIEEFIMQLNEIIEDANKICNLKEKVEKQINNTRELINNSGICHIKTDDSFFDDVLFENLICCDTI